MAEKEYIERERVRREFELFFQDNKKLVDDCDSLICMLPTADVFEVVRCKDCRHAFFRYNNDRYPFGVYACRKQPSGRAYKKVRGDFWCAYGEKMDGKGDK